MAVQSQIVTFTRAIGTAFRILDLVETAKQLIEVGQFVSKVMVAISLGRPEAVVNDVFAGLGGGAQGALPNFLDGLKTVRNHLGDRWQQYASRIISHSHIMGSEAAAYAFRNMFPKWKKKKNRVKFYASFPTGTGSFGRDFYVPVSRQWSVAIPKKPGGGRLFGIGALVSNKDPGKGVQNLPQGILRVDWWEFGIGEWLHYHVGPHERGKGRPIPAGLLGPGRR